MTEEAIKRIKTLILKINEPTDTRLGRLETWIYKEDVEALKMAIEVLEQKDCIKIPEVATNGEMIKALFPNAKTWEVTREDIHCAYIEFEDICEIKSFPLSWWNSPYGKE